MTEPRVAPYGSWRSPITPELITAGAVRPRERGRNVVVRWSARDGAADVTPPEYDARTRAHEYGGGAYAVSDGTVYFSHYLDQRLYRQDRGAAPRPITPEAALRYADGAVDRARGRLICVREDHIRPGQEAAN